MNKLALNFICKNESPVVERMLKSNKSIIDLIVCNDTGSTDGTQEIIKNWGKENNIPTYVFERPFDNFESSRNYAMQKLRDVVNELGWDPNTTYGYWIDCDEEMVVESNFDKMQFNKDLFMINTYIGSMKYTRNTFFRVSKPFRFYGPVHEFIVCDDPNITSGLASGLYVKVSMDGFSWTGNIADKYKKHAAILEDYIDNKDRNPRWVFYTAQSYHDSSSLDNRNEVEERLRRALKYYKERVSRMDGYEEERFYSQYRIGTVMRALEMPWHETQSELLKAYAMDPLRAEPIKVIADHYLMMGEWNLAYLYTKFLKVNFHNKNPYPQRLLFVDESLYLWRILEVHSAACFYTNRKEEAKINFMEILDAQKKYPQYFNQDDIQKINSNAQFFK